MKIDPNQARMIALTNYEIMMIIDMMRKNVPSKENEQAVVNVVHKLQKAIQM